MTIALTRAPLSRYMARKYVRCVLVSLVTGVAAFTLTFSYLLVRSEASDASRFHSGEAELSVAIDVELSNEQF